jgi:hypothetical protein
MDHPETWKTSQADTVGSQCMLYQAITNAFFKTPENHHFLKVTQFTRSLRVVRRSSGSGSLNNSIDKILIRPPACT